MTPQELAEKIHEYYDGHLTDKFADLDIKFVESLLSAAMEEERETGNILKLLTIERIQKEAKAAAYEDAAEIADDEDCVCTDEVNCHGSVRIAEKIRRRAEEMK